MSKKGNLVALQLLSGISCTIDPETKLMCESIGSIVRLMRNRKSMTQVDLSNQTGLSQPTISEIEKGKSLDMKNLIKVARGLDIELSRLVRAAENIKQDHQKLKTIVDTASRICEELESNSHSSSNDSDLIALPGGR